MADGANPFADLIPTGSTNPPGAGNPFADLLPASGAGRFAQPRVAPDALTIENAQRAWSDVPGEALRNAPESGWSLAKAVAHPVLHPQETAETFGFLMDGLGNKLVRSGVLGAPPTAVEGDAISRQLGYEVAPKRDDAEVEATADAIGQFYKDRYGSLDGLKKTLATDPVGVGADLAMLLTGGGGAMARVPGAVGRVGEVVRTAGSVIDPVANAGRVAALGARGVGRAGANLLGVSTGTGTLPIEIAYQAGREGGPANRAFTENMRGQVPMRDVVDTAEQAVSAMGRERSADYTANMAATRATPGTLGIGDVDQAIGHAANSVQYRGFMVDPAANAIIERMQGARDAFMALPASERTAEGFDAFKRALRAIREDTQQGTGARRVADEIYNATRQTIVRQSPSYATAMRDYATASEDIDAMRRTMSINDRAATDTTLRKLQSTMRNNVTTNWGERTRLLDELAVHQPDLPYALAGQSMSALAPRGLARVVAGGNLAAAAGAMNPLMLASLPATSPRLVGETVNAAGRVVGGAQRAGQAVGLTPEIASNALLSLAASRAAWPDQP